MKIAAFVLSWVLALGGVLTDLPAQEFTVEQLEDVPSLAPQTHECYRELLTCGRSTSGTIDIYGCVFTNPWNYYDVYEVATSMGKVIFAEARSTDFRPWVVIYNRAGNPVAWDPQPEYSVSRASYTAEYTGAYMIAVIAEPEFETGDYTLTTSCTTPTCEAPVIISQPQDSYLRYGQQTYLYVDVAGTPPFSFQWMQTQPVQQNLSPYQTLYTPPLTSSTAKFKVVISNACGTTVSREATLTLLPSRLRAARRR